MPTWELIASAAGGASFNDDPGWSAPAGKLALDTPETRQQTKVYSSYTWADLYVRVITFNLPNSVVNSRIGAAQGNQTVTVTGTGVFQDTVNTDALVDGNLIDIQHDQVGAGAKLYTVWGSTLEDTTSNLTLQVANSDATQVLAFGTTFFTVIEGASNVAGAGMASTETDVQYTLRRDTTYSSLRVFLKANSVNGDSTWRLRVNAANVNQTVTLTASTTGAFEDTTNSDAVSAADEINYTLVTGGTSGTMVPTLSQMKHTSTGREMASAQPVGVSRTADAYLAAESNGTSTATEANVQIAARASFTARNLFVNVKTHGLTSGVDIFLRQNTANSAMTVNIPQSTTGLFEDTTNSVSIAVADVYNYFLDKGAGAGEITVTIIGMEQGPTDVISGGQFPTQLLNQMSRGRGRGRGRGVGHGFRVPV